MKSSDQQPLAFETADTVEQQLFPCQFNFSVRIQSYNIGNSRQLESILFQADLTQNWLSVFCNECLYTSQYSY